MEIAVIPRHRPRSLTPSKKLIHNRCSLWENCSLRTMFFLCMSSLIFSLVLFFFFFFFLVLEGRKFVTTTVFPQTPRTSQQHFLGVLFSSFWSMDLTKTNSRRGVSTVYDFDLYQVVVICETSDSCNKIYLLVMTVIVWSGSSMQNVLIIPIINIAICSSSNVIVNFWASNTVILNLFLC